MTTLSTDATGLFPDVPFADYCSWPAMNVSTLCAGFLRDGRRELFSPPHLLAAIERRKPRVETPDTQFGHALHARLLEPQRFATEYLVAGTCHAILRGGNICGNQGRLHDGDRWYCGVRGHAPPGAVEPREFVTLEAYRRIERIAEQMARHKALRLLRQQGGFELSYRTMLEGVPVKGRIDKDLPRPAGKFPPMVVDIKTVGARRHVDSIFFKQALELNYHAKMAWYCRCLKQIDGIERQAVWVIVEKEEPYTISVRMCPPELLAAGWEKIYAALVTYRTCMERQEWPTLYDDLQRLALPDWWSNEHDG